MLLTEVVVGQHLLNLFGDGVRVELGRHGHHLLDADARVAGDGQRGAELRVAARRVLGQGFEPGGLRGQRVPGQAVDGLLGGAEGRLRGGAAAGRRLGSPLCVGTT